MSSQQPNVDINQQFSRSLEFVLQHHLHHITQFCVFTSQIIHSCFDQTLAFLSHVYRTVLTTTLRSVTHLQPRLAYFISSRIQTATQNQPSWLRRQCLSYLLQSRICPSISPRIQTNPWSISLSPIVSMRPIYALSMPKIDRTQCSMILT